MSDAMLRGIVGGATARLVAVDATALADQTRQMHGLTLDAVQVAAEAVVASVLLASQIKGEERISFQLQGSKPELAFMADVDSNGGLRARFTPEVVRLPYFGRLEGMLMVHKSMPGQELYRGVTEIRAEPIEAALSRHLGESTQIDAILRIGAQVAEDGTVSQAGGVFLERLPAPPDRELEASAEFVVQFDPLREMSMEEILAAVRGRKLLGAPVEALDEIDLHWRCSCGQERVEAILLSLGPDELRDMLDTDGEAEVICHFCNIGYAVAGERLAALLVKAEGIKA